MRKIQLQKSKRTRYQKGKSFDLDSILECLESIWVLVFDRPMFCLYFIHNLIELTSELLNIIFVLYLIEGHKTLNEFSHIALCTIELVCNLPFHCLCPSNQAGLHNQWILCSCIFLIRHLITSARNNENPIGTLSIIGNPLFPEPKAETHPTLRDHCNFCSHYALLLIAVITLVWDWAICLGLMIGVRKIMLLNMTFALKCKPQSQVVLKTTWEGRFETGIMWRRIVAYGKSL